MTRDTIFIFICLLVLIFLNCIFFWWLFQLYNKKKRKLNPWLLPKNIFRHLLVLHTTRNFCWNLTSLSPYHNNQSIEPVSLLTAVLIEPRSYLLETIPTKQCLKVLFVILLANPKFSFCHLVSNLTRKIYLRNHTLLHREKHHSYSILVLILEKKEVPVK